MITGFILIITRLTKDSAVFLSTYIRMEELSVLIVFLSLHGLEPSLGMKLEIIRLYRSFLDMIQDFRRLISIKV